MLKLDKIYNIKFLLYKVSRMYSSLYRCISRMLKVFSLHITGIFRNLFDFPTQKIIFFGTMSKTLKMGVRLGQARTIVNEIPSPLF